MTANRDCSAALALLIRRVACAVALFVAALGAPASARDILVSPDGDDARDGATAAMAVRSLQRAIDLAIDNPGDGAEATAIIIASGTYRRQSAELDPRKLKGPLVIRGASDNPLEYPAFLGNGLPIWLTVNAAAGRDTGLTVQNLRIADYGTAITLNGHRDDPARFNSGTSIIGNVFARIGNTSDGALSTAAIRMVNSRNNLVRGNYFLSIRNSALCEAMHALYLAHFSSGNTVEDNSFDDFCGSAIKFRDRSNHNEILRNRFATKARVPIIEEWFCDRVKSNACTKAEGECPSTGNIAGDNRFIGIARDRRLVTRGGAKPRDWCGASDFSDRRLVARDSH